MGFCCQRTTESSPLRFCPIQTTLGQDLLVRYNMPTDVSTAVLLDKKKQVAYQNSDSVLRLFPYLGFPYSWLGPFLITMVPQRLRDFGYHLFARNRGQIWKGVKRITGMGDTKMTPYRSKVLGLDNMTISKQPGWGFESTDGNCSGCSK